MGNRMIVPCLLACSLAPVTAQVRIAKGLTTTAKTANDDAPFDDLSWI